MKMLSFLILTIIFIRIKQVHNHQCGADNLNLRPKPLKIKSAIKNNLVKSNSYSPISIGYDFSSFIKPDSMKESTFSELKLILKETRVEFSKLLQVIHQEIDLAGRKYEIMDSCNLDVIGKDYKNFLIKNDLIIFPVISSELSTSVAAAAGACITHPDTNRPIMGILYISQIMDQWKKNWKIKIKNTLFHEITHILGFSYNFFSNLNMVIKEGNIYYINSTKVLEQTKKYFGCDNLPYPGVPLENQGGAGSAKSHWEGRYMYGEYMNMETLPDIAISDITLALLEDTGFYKVNYFSGGLFKFGKNKGCDFLIKECIENDTATFEEFCDLPKEPKCTSSLTSKSSCDLESYNFDIPYKHFSNTSLGGMYFTNFCSIAYEYGSTSDNFPKHCQLQI